MNGAPPGVLVLFGTGEHARVVADGALAAGWIVAGVVGDSPSPPGLTLLGGDREVARIQDANPGCRFLIAIGDNSTRKALADRLGPLPWATVVHPSAAISGGAVLGPGVFIGPLAVVNTGAVIGPHALVNSGAVVEHDVKLGAFCHLAPGAVIGGGSEIGEAALVGLGARVRDHLRVGEGALVAMGAVVTSDVDAGRTVAGVPEKPLGNARRKG